MPVSSRREFLKQLGAATIAAAWMPSALAEDLIRLQRAELVRRHDAYHLIGGFQIKLTGALEEALQRGVTLTFLQQFEADRPRDFWFADEATATEHRKRRERYVQDHFHHRDGRAGERVAAVVEQVLS